MHNKFKIKPIDVLNLKGLNTLTLAGSASYFTDDAASSSFQAILSKEEKPPVEGNVSPIPFFNNNGVTVSVTVKRADVGGLSEKEVFDNIISQLGVAVDAAPVSAKSGK